MSSLPAERMNEVVDETWDFRRANTKYCTHGLHNYPAMMIPQVARRIIQEFSPGKASILLDPFCGSGSALVEAKLLGLNSYGVDINPLARFLSEVKTTSLEPVALLKHFKKLKEKILLDAYEGNYPLPPKFFNIDYWFKPKVILELALIKKNVDIFTDQELKDIGRFFLVAFSETVREASNTRNGEFKLYRIPDEQLESHTPEVFKLFFSKCERNIVKMSDLYNQCDKTKWVKVLNEDTREKLSIFPKSVDILVTSPPYGDSRTTTAYGQFSRLSLQWLGNSSLGNDVCDETIRVIDKNCLGGNVLKELDNDSPSSDLQESIEQIAHKDNLRARQVLSFYYDFYKCLRQIDKVMANPSHICMVVGNRTVKKVKIPTDQILVQLGRSLNWKHLKTIIRNIPSKRMPFKNSPTNIKGDLETTMHQEYIVVFEHNK